MHLFFSFFRHPPADGHAELLRRVDCILSPCEHHCAYLRRWGPQQPRLCTRPLWAAKYHYFLDTSVDTSETLPGTSETLPRHFLDTYLNLP